MKHSSQDRRKTETHPPFPLEDSMGHKVRSDRRCGKERRKNQRDSDIAGQILTFFH